MHSTSSYLGQKQEKNWRIREIWSWKRLCSPRPSREIRFRVTSIETHLHTYKAALDRQISIYEFSSIMEIPLKIILSLRLKRFSDIHGNHPGFKLIQFLFELPPQDRKWIITVFFKRKPFKMKDLLPSYKKMETMPNCFCLKSWFHRIIE